MSHSCDSHVTHATPTPGVQWFELLSVPCSRLGMAVFGSIAVAYRIKMVSSLHSLPSPLLWVYCDVVCLSSAQYQCCERPYLPTAANVSCLLCFLLSLLNPLHVEYEISVRQLESLSLSLSSPHISLPLLPPQVVLSSLVFLLIQPDGRLFPLTSSLFLAPSLLSAAAILYILAGGKIIPRTLSAVGKGPPLLLASRSHIVLIPPFLKWSL